MVQLLVEEEAEATPPLPPQLAVKAVAVVRVGTELVVSRIQFVEVHRPAVTLARAVAAAAETAAPPENVGVSLAPKLPLVAISGVAVRTTVIFKSQRVGGVIAQGGTVMGVVRPTIGLPALVHVELGRKPTIAGHRARAVSNVAHTGLHAVQQPSPELPPMTV